MPRPNEAALKSAPEVTPPKAKPEAFLLEYNRDPTIQRRLWTFFYNPQTLDWSRSAKYSAVETFAAKVQDQQYGYTDGKALEVPDIYLDTYCLGRTVRPLLEGINTLLEARLDKGEFAPPVLSFVFGGQIFAPCVLVKATWKETAWIGGDPARVRMSLSFLEIPLDRDDKAKELQLKSDDPKLAAKTAEGKPRQPLTDRQKKDASDQAKKWLKENNAKLDAQTQKTVRSNSYSLLTNGQSGDVKMFDAKKQAIGTVGRWDGTKFTTANVNTLIKPKAK